MSQSVVVYNGKHRRGRDRQPFAVRVVVVGLGDEGAFAVVESSLHSLSVHSREAILSRAVVELASKLMAASGGVEPAA